MESPSSRGRKGKKSKALSPATPKNRKKKKKKKKMRKPTCRLDTFLDMLLKARVGAGAVLHCGWPVCLHLT